MSAAMSFIRSVASRTVRKVNLVAETRVSRSKCSPFAIPKQNSLSNPMLRSPVELSCCVEKILPYHTVTASALLTSMFSVSCRSYGWNPKEVMLLIRYQKIARTRIPIYCDACLKLTSAKCRCYNCLMHSCE